MPTTTLLVRRDQLATTRLRTQEDSPLKPGEVRVRIDAFALTSNNITYAAFGDAMGYWQFYPSGEEGWGQIPVWGFASVSQSLHPGVAVGERLYGYWPMASSTVLAPDRLSALRFADGAPHRAELAAVYNQYFRCTSDPLYTPDTEATQALLRPLFITSWLIDDFLEDNDFFGIRSQGTPGVVVLSSASSKTAYGTAFLLHQRPGVEVVGLTSAANKAFCESLGCYHRVLAYEELDQVAADAPCVYVDFAGNGELRRAIHTRFANLRYSSSIGGTHVDQLAASGAGKRLPGPRATLFFAPAQIKKRTAEWGADVFGQRMAAAWRAFVAQVGGEGSEASARSPWLTVTHHRGDAAVQAAYAQVLAGRGDPRTGHILSLAPGTDAG
ncbi:DUF2855 family protein [Variovorax ginsengisoli]|uniref:DUF2855 family protein n=1 Tax=Variovorax ginsengisoli TaxID=363844 RepID=A0ABT9SCH9_9BURK|nr:DUF2855 family protein [Variovorax ginsengisoli]MDP9902039.1 hypothetical protein [Variovorax ginsengisoli]